MSLDVVPRCRRRRLALGVLAISLSVIAPPYWATQVERSPFHRLNYKMETKEGRNVHSVPMSGAHIISPGTCIENLEEINRHGRVSTVSPKTRSNQEGGCQRCRCPTQWKSPSCARGDHTSMHKKHTRTRIHRPHCHKRKLPQMPSRVPLCVISRECLRQVTGSRLCSATSNIRVIDGTLNGEPSARPAPT